MASRGLTRAIRVFPFQHVQAVVLGALLVGTRAADGEGGAVSRVGRPVRPPRPALPRRTRLRPDRPRDGAGLLFLIIIESSTPGTRWRRTRRTSPADSRRSWPGSPRRPEAALGLPAQGWPPAGVPAALRDVRAASLGCHLLTVPTRRPRATDSGAQRMRDAGPHPGRRHRRLTGLTKVCAPVSFIGGRWAAP